MSKYQLRLTINGSQYFWLESDCPFPLIQLNEFIDGEILEDKSGRFDYEVIRVSHGFRLSEDDKTVTEHITTLYLAKQSVGV